MCVIVVWNIVEHILWPAQTDVRAPGSELVYRDHTMQAALEVHCNFQWLPKLTLKTLKLKVKTFK